MAQDYDAVRPDVAERNEQVLKEVAALETPDTQTATEDFEESAVAGVQEPPGAIIEEELVVEVLPPTQHEFICDQCFLVRHPSMLAEHDNGKPICRDCTAD